MESANSSDAMAVYHCSFCNIWACTKSQGELLHCRRCSRPLQPAPDVNQLVLILCLIRFF